jgi:hypothetical protein
LASVIAIGNCWVITNANARNRPAAMNVTRRSAEAGLPLARMRMVKMPISEATRPAAVYATGSSMADPR